MNLGILKNNRCDLGHDNYKQLKPCPQLLPPLHMYKSQKAAMKRWLSWEKIQDKPDNFNLLIRKQIDYDTNTIG